MPKRPAPIDPCRLDPPVDPMTNFPPLRPPANAPVRKRSKSEPMIDPGIVRSMSEDEKMDAILALLKILSEQTIRIAFASGTTGLGQLDLKQRRSAAQRLFNRTLNRISLIDPSFLDADLPGGEFHRKERTKAAISK
jgi:hypothetical protein